MFELALIYLYFQYPSRAPDAVCLSQRLSHASLSISFYTAKLRMAHNTVLVYLMGPCPWAHPGRVFWAEASLRRPPSCGLRLHEGWLVPVERVLDRSTGVMHTILCMRIRLGWLETRLAQNTLHYLHMY